MRADPATRTWEGESRAGMGATNRAQEVEHFSELALGQRGQGWQSSGSQVISSLACMCACARPAEWARACVTRNCDLDGSDRGAASHSASPAKSVAQECRERRVSAERGNPRACNCSQTWSRDALGQGSAGRAVGSEAVN